MKGLNARWTHGVSHIVGERNKVYRTILGARGGFEILGEILEELQADLHSELVKPPKYEDASWAYRQAHLNGQLESIRKLKSILPDEETLADLERQLTETP